MLEKVKTSEIEKVLRGHPETSSWLKSQLEELESMDLYEALLDAEMLTSLLKIRLSLVNNQTPLLLREFSEI